MWQTPPEGTWQARQQRLDWLGLAMSDAKEMFFGLRRHWNLLEQQNRITEAVDLMKVCYSLALCVCTNVPMAAYMFASCIECCTALLSRSQSTLHTVVQLLVLAVA